MLKLSSKDIERVGGLVAGYISDQRTKYFPHGQALSGEHLTAFTPFFPATVLRRARVLELKGERVGDPAFFGVVKMMGIRNLPSFREMAAITFDDVIVSHEAFTPRLLFHELVHVTQYAQLGVDGFAKKYVDGFLKGGGYDDIPLEKMAYALEAKFAGGLARIDVGGEVEQWFHDGRA